MNGRSAVAPLPVAAAAGRKWRPWRHAATLLAIARVLDPGNPPAMTEARLAICRHAAWERPAVAAISG